MDEQSIEVVKATAAGVAEGTTTAFLNTLLGPLVEAAESWREIVRLRRWKAELKMLDQAESFLVERGIDPQRVPVKVLFPLLDYAAREDPDDDEMILRWAALLANAAAGGERGAVVLPSFPRILSELSPEEAAILDVLYRDPDPTRVPSLYHRYPADPELAAHGDPLFYTRCFSLEALGLLEAHWENAHVDDTNPPLYEHQVHYLVGNALGLSFVLACTPPHA